MEKKLDLTTLLENFNENFPTPEVIKAINNYFSSKRKLDEIRPILEKCQNDIIQKHNFKSVHGLNDKEIKTSNDMWRVSNEDFLIYQKEYIIEREKLGFFTEDDDSCPLLIAENNFRIAERNLICAMEPFTKISLEMLIRNYENYEKYFKLILPLIEPFEGRR